MVSQSNLDTVSLTSLQKLPNVTKYRVPNFDRCKGAEVIKEPSLPRDDNDYFLLQVFGKLSIWFTQKLFFKIVYMYDFNKS